MKSCTTKSETAITAAMSKTIPILSAAAQMPAGVSTAMLGMQRVKAMS